MFHNTEMAAEAENDQTIAVNLRGRPWTVELDQSLWATLKSDGRSAGAIRLRLLKIAVTKIDQGDLTPEVAMAHISATPEEVAKYRKKIADQEEGRELKKQETVKKKEEKAAGEIPLEVAAENLNLTPDQAAALAAVRQGDSILLTGVAGTGKSYVLAEISKDAALRLPGSRTVALTASTGTAAQLIGGRTLHSWLGVGRAEGDVASWRPSKAAQIRMRAARLLIIDEVSMLEAGFFDNLSTFLSTVRENLAIFGGLQLVLVGDFAQLPPVRGNYAFTSRTWSELAPRQCNLTTVMRQNSVDFQMMLCRLRLGQPQEADLERLMQCRHTAFQNGIIPTRLCALNRDADAINQRELGALLKSGAAPVQFAMTLRGGDGSWTKSLNIPETLMACVGAQVMVTRNITGRNGRIELANGTRAVIVAADDGSATIRLSGGTVRILTPQRAIEEGNARNAVVFMPLALAWAISIHRSQGATLDALEVDLGPSIFEAGQAYVAISRARDLSAVRITRLDSRAFRCHPAVLEFYGE